MSLENVGYFKDAEEESATNTGCKLIFADSKCNVNLCSTWQYFADRNIRLHYFKYIRKLILIFHEKDFSNKQVVKQYDIIENVFFRGSVLNRNWL